MIQSRVLANECIAISERALWVTGDQSRSSVLCERVNVSFARINNKRFVTCTRGNGELLDSFIPDAKHINMREKRERERESE